MSSNGFDTREFDKYTKSMIRMAETDFPKETKKFMRSEAQKGVKECKSTARSKVGKVTGNYLKGFKKGSKIFSYGGVQYNILIYNSAPHAHLIEFGHEKFIRGKDTGGRVPGYYVLQEAAEKFEPKFADDIENELIEFIKKGLEG